MILLGVAWTGVFYCPPQGGVDFTEHHQVAPKYVAMARGMVGRVIRGELDFMEAKRTHYLNSSGNSTALHYGADLTRSADVVVYSGFRS